MPFLALVLEQVTLRGTLAIDEWLTWIPPWPLGVSGTMAAIQTIIFAYPGVHRLHLWVDADRSPDC